MIGSIQVASFHSWQPEIEPKKDLGLFCKFRNNEWVSVISGELAPLPDYCFIVHFVMTYVLNLKNLFDRHNRYCDDLIPPR